MTFSQPHPLFKRKPSPTDILGRVLACTRCGVAVDVIEVGCGPRLEPDRFVCDQCHVPVVWDGEPSTDWDTG